MERGHLRVAFVCPDLWVGGGTVFTLNLASEFMRWGIPCHVFSINETSSLASDFKRLRIPVDSEPSCRIIEDRISGALEKLKRFAPTAIITNTTTLTSELMRYIPPGVLRIGCVHLAVPTHSATAARYRSVFEMFVGVSPEVVDALHAALNGGSPPVRCIDLGVPLPPESFQRDVTPTDAPLRILYLGRLENDAKRVLSFPSIFERLQAAGIPFHWTIAGDGPDRAQLQARMSGDARQSVRFAGVVPYGEVPSLLASHDIFLLTSDTESFCLSLHEAMAYGLVPVVSAIPGRVAEVVTAETGLSVPVENIDGYADAIVWLHHHRQEAAKMSAAAREAIRSFHSASAMADRWLSLLGEHPIQPVHWPDRWRVGALLRTRTPLRFTAPGRLLRRLTARVRQAFLAINKLRTDAHP